jgi:hypothetical protein
MALQIKHMVVAQSPCRGLVHYGAGGVCYSHVWYGVVGREVIEYESIAVYASGRVGGGGVNIQESAVNGLAAIFGERFGDNLR